jgi:hypothetical protein
VRKKFERNNPDEKVLASDGCKGIITEQNQDIKRGTQWLASKRAVLLLTEKRIICGKWIIPLETVATARLSRIKALFMDGQVLKIQTEDGKNYQFGMQFNTEWANQQALPLSYENEKVKYSLFSILIRVYLIGYLVYWLWERFTAGA